MPIARQEQLQPIVQRLPPYLLPVAKLGSHAVGSRHMIAIMHDKIVSLFASAPVRQWKAGQTLFRVGDRPIVLHLVVSGPVALARMLADGTELTLHSAVSGNVLAEASASAQTYHCDARAMVASQTRAVDLAAFRAAVDRQPGIAAAWAADLARAVRQARFRIEVRSLRRVRARLDAWRSEGHTWPLSGPLQDIAAEIGVMREAFYSAFARRSRDQSAMSTTNTVSLRSSEVVL